MQFLPQRPQLFFFRSMGSLAALVFFSCVLLPAPAVLGLKYLFISSPQRGKVFYHEIGYVDDEANAAGHWRPKRLPDPNAVGAAPVPTPSDPPLLIDHGLMTPMGLAVSRFPYSLFVADSGKKSILEYELTVYGLGGPVAGSQKTAVMNVESRWVAVDSRRNLYISDEGNSLIQICELEAKDKYREPRTLYKAASVSPPAVSGPGGVAVDGFFLYWTNKLEGAQTGSVVKGYEVPPDVAQKGMVSKLATNAIKAYGVCTSHSNVFYTGDANYVYGVKKAGGSPAVVSADMMKKPRGCAWDGDGTIFVADREGNAIYSFPANMPTMRGVSNVRKTLGIKAPFGVAVYNGAAGLRAFGGILVALIASVASFMA